MKDYSDLKNKTVLDICKDNEVLEEVLPYVPTGCDKMQFYLGYYKDNPTNNALAMLEVAEITCDVSLKKAVAEQFKDELNDYFNE